MEREEKERKRQRRIRINIEHVRKHNAKIIPDTPGCVRIDGPSRQSIGKVDNQGRITWIEI